MPVRKSPKKRPASSQRPAKAQRAPTPLEKDFQKAASEYLDLALPSHATHTCFPAGGGGKIRGANLKRMGLKTGWPDIQILVRASSFDQAVRSFSRFIGLELKRDGGGVVSFEQSERHGEITNAGGVVYVVRTLDQIERALTVGEGLRLRIKLGA